MKYTFKYQTLEYFSGFECRLGICGL